MIIVFKEMRGLEYTLEILRVFYHNPGRHDSKDIYNFIYREGKIQPSLTYIQKILPRMAKIKLLVSSEAGYSLMKPLNVITVSNVLDLCDMPDLNSSLYKFCNELKKMVSSIYIHEFYEFN